MPTRQGELRFDGQVAVITGAGGQAPSLGGEYARLLASRGAKVVVNDLGVGFDGGGALPSSAQAVVHEIVDAGGEAIGDTHSVAEPASARAAVQTALDAWGRIDILVNNAGVGFFALFEEISENDIRLVVDTHLYGTIWMSRAAWPHMKEAGYGRIVNIASEALIGQPYLPLYGAAKAGIVGLTRALALEGALSGIKVNAVAPRADTRQQPYMMGIDPESSTLAARLGTVSQVAPVVAYLGHERCELNGTLLQTNAGRVHELRLYETVGYENPGLTIEDVEANAPRIIDRTGAAPVEDLGLELFDLMPRRTYEPR